MQGENMQIPCRKGGIQTQDQRCSTMKPEVTLQFFVVVGHLDQENKKTKEKLVGQFLK